MCTTVDSGILNLKVNLHWKARKQKRAKYCYNVFQILPLAAKLNRYCINMMVMIMMLFILLVHMLKFKVLQCLGNEVIWKRCLVIFKVVTSSYNNTVQHWILLRCKIYQLPCFQIHRIWKWYWFLHHTPASGSVCSCRILLSQSG